MCLCSWGLSSLNIRAEFTENSQQTGGAACIVPLGKCDNDESVKTQSVLSVWVLRSAEHGLQALQHCWGTYDLVSKMSWYY